MARTQRLTVPCTAALLALTITPTVTSATAATPTAVTAPATTAPAAVSNLFSSGCPYTVKIGQTNGCVTRLQGLLNSRMSAGLVVDGVFGTKTADAVKKWQDARGLTVDGVVGPQTKRTLEGTNRAVAYWARRLDATTSDGNPRYIFGAGHGTYPGPTNGGIDCSGFTRLVASYTMGKDVLGTGSAKSQYDTRLRHVSASSRQPGDFVYFYGYRNGVYRIVHTGVYIGDGLVVHSVKGWGQDGIGTLSLSSLQTYYNTKAPVYGRL